MYCTCTYVFSDIACTLHTDWLRWINPPKPSCRSPSPPTLHLGLLRPHATLLSKSQKKLHRLALPTSPKRSGDHALNIVFLTPANNNLSKPPEWCAPCEPWELDCTNLFQASRFMIGGTIWFIRVNSQGERVWFDGKNERSGGTNSPNFPRIRSVSGRQ